MFAVSKLVGWLIMPSNLLILLVLLSALLPSARSRVLGLLRRLPAIVLALVAFLPVGEMLLHPLEERFPQPDELPEEVAGIVVLGGATETWIGTHRGQPHTNEAAERLHQSFYLARRYPDAEIVFAGGSAAAGWEEGDPTEWETARDWYAEAGLDLDRLVREDRSRNTRENAVFSKQQVQPEDGERWLLITSAWHMPRSVGIFRQVDFEVVPYPVDYRTTDTLTIDWWIFASHNLQKLDYAAHEWIGLVYYRLRDWTPTLFPAPRS